MELTELQKRIVESNSPKIAVEACAAALKTSTLTEKVRKLLRDGVNPQSIAVITFTRMAAAELISRLGEDFRDGIFVGTIHALAAKILNKHGYGKEIDDIVENEDFDKLFQLCTKFNIEKTFDWILVDECQDTGTQELEFIFERLNPDHYFVVFDRRQSIYQFRGARPDKLIRYISDATFYPLNENYRNGYNILKFAKKIISKTSLEDDSIAAKRGNGTVREEAFSYQKIKAFIESEGTYGDWAILARTNSEVDNIIMYLNTNKIPSETFKQGDLKREDLLKRMDANTVKVLTIHSAKGLAFNNVIVVDARMYNEEECNISYVAATRARENLIWMTFRKKKRGF